MESRNLHKAIREYIINEDSNKNNILLLLNDNVDINAQDQKGMTALHLLCKTNYLIDIELIDVLLSKNANPNLLDNIQQTPLYYLLNNEEINIEAVELLLKNKADPNIAYYLSETILHLVLKNNYTDPKLVKLLLDYGANPDLANEDSLTPLHSACENNEWEIIKLLLEKTKDINQKDTLSRNGLHYFCRNHKIQTQNLTTLLSYQPEIDLADKYKVRPLHHLCGNSNATLAMVKLLISKGADYSALSYKEKNCLHLACEYVNDHRIVEFFIEKGLSVLDSHSYYSDHTPFYYAVVADNPNNQIIEILLKHKPNINIKIDVVGINCLTLAAIRDTPYPTKTVGILIKAGLELNKQTPNDDYPLVSALEKNNYRMAFYFILEGAQCLKLEGNLSKENMPRDPLLKNLIDLCQQLEKNNSSNRDFHLRKYLENINNTKISPLIQKKSIFASALIVPEHFDDLSEEQLQKLLKNIVFVMEIHMEIDHKHKLNKL